MGKFQPYRPRLVLAQYHALMVQMQTAGAVSAKRLWQGMGAGRRRLGDCCEIAMLAAH